jgi:hypothetical protein
LFWTSESISDTENKIQNVDKISIDLKDIYVYILQYYVYILILHIYQYYRAVPEGRSGRSRQWRTAARRKCCGGSEQLGAAIKAEQHQAISNIVWCYRPKELDCLHRADTENPLHPAAWCQHRICAVATGDSHCCA